MITLTLIKSVASSYPPVKSGARALKGTLITLPDSEIERVSGQGRGDQWRST